MTRSIGGVGLSPDRLQRLSEIERWHFWFIARRALVERLLGEYLGAENQLVLDLGCGTGMMLKNLDRKGYRLIGLDMRLEGLRSAKTETVNPRLMQADAIHLPLMHDAFDAVISLDVIEHANDKAVVGEIGRILRPDGLAIMSVPAMSWLWSYRDEAAGHLRRYQRREISDLLAGSDLRMTGFNQQSILEPL